MRNTRQDYHELTPKKKKKCEHRDSQRSGGVVFLRYNNMTMTSSNSDTTSAEAVPSATISPEPTRLLSTSPSSENDDIHLRKSVYEQIMTSSASAVAVSSSNSNKNAAYDNRLEEANQHYNYASALHRPIPTINTSTATTTSTSPFQIQNLTKASLPYFQPWFCTSGPTELPPDFSWLSNSCGGKAAIGVFGGGVMGLLMGVFLGAMSDATPPVTVIAGKDVPQAPLREQVKVTMRATAEKSMYWCRNFAFITGVFGGSECLVEKYRGKHDVWNPVASGCITGAALQAKQGPQAAALGCGGFAAFSLVIDSFMGHY